MTPDQLFRNTCENLCGAIKQVRKCPMFRLILGRMRTPVREAFSYGIRHGIRYIHCDSMKYDLMLHWITMNMPYAVPYPVWKCLPYGSTHPPYCHFTPWTRLLKFAHFCPLYVVQDNLWIFWFNKDPFWLFKFPWTISDCSIKNSFFKPLEKVLKN